MNQLLKTGRFFYGISIAAFGVHQFIIKDFGTETLEPFPSWAHQYVIFPILTGIFLVFCGLIISGLLKIKRVKAKNVCICLGFYFFILVIACHLPYILIFSPNQASHLGVWDGAVESLAHCGGAFLIAASFSENSFTAYTKDSSGSFSERLIPVGRIFFATLLIVYGISHFVYTAYVSPMVPKWIGIPIFWTYFGGSALICSGIAILFNIWTKYVAFLLAIMLFLWLILVNVPAAIANPYASNGFAIIDAFDALLFCGIALVIAATYAQKSSLNYSLKVKSI